MRYFLLLFIGSCVFYACGKDAAISSDAQLTGSWQLQRALRNNMETSTLDGLYFEFGSDGDLTTNLMSETAQQGSYVQEEGQIITQGVNLPLTYTITSMTDSTLHLKSRYQGYQFVFELVRQD